MELVELHVGEFCACKGGESDAVASSDGGVGGIGIDLACPASSDEDGAGADALRFWIGNMGAGGSQIYSDDAAARSDEVCRHGPLGKADPLVGAGKGDERAADLCAGCVAAGVEDAGQRVSTFAGAEKLAGLLVKLCAPLDELGEAGRAFGDEGLRSGAVDDAVAGVQGVFKMESDVLIAFHGDGDSALGIVGVGLAESFLGDDQDLAVGSQFDGSAEAGNASSHDKKINLRSP